MLEEEPCKECCGTGINMNYYFLGRQTVFDCLSCNGSGYRCWIDEIKRPSKSESGISKTE